MVQVKRYGARGPLSAPPQLGEYEVVLAWQAEAAIAAAFESGMDQMIGGIEQVSYDKGQADMLAKCIAVVENVLNEPGTPSDLFAALRALQKMP